MSKILLVRHGQTEYNNSSMFGGITDSELSAIGRRQIELLRDRLAEEKIDSVICSDLKRAMESVKIITAGRKLEPYIYSELRK